VEDVGDFEAEIVRGLESTVQDLVSAFEEALEYLKLRVQRPASRLRWLAGLVKQSSPSRGMIGLLERAETYAERRAVEMTAKYYEALHGPMKGEEVRRRALVYACAALLADYHGGFTVQQLATAVAWACAGMRDPPFKPTAEAVQLLASLPLREALRTVEKEKKLNAKTELLEGGGYWQVYNLLNELRQTGLIRRELKNVDNGWRRKEYLYYIPE